MTQELNIAEYLNPVEVILQSIVTFIVRSYSLINKAAGLIGITILIPLFVVVSLIVWIILKGTNSRLNNLISKLFKRLDTENKRELMLMESALRGKRIELDKTIENSKVADQFFLIRPLIDQLKYSRKIFYTAEQRLHKSVYPEAHVEFSEEQKKQLLELSNNFEGIWEESDYKKPSA
jgi:membrane protein implicated in regulation of membrane protease activity